MALMTQTFAQCFARRVATETKAQGRTQIQLAEKLGMTQSQVSRKFRGVNAFQLDELPLLAEFLGLTVGQLVDGQAAGNSGQYPVSSAPTPSAS